MIDEKELEAVLEEIQATEVRTGIRNRLFNQPNLITISSADRDTETLNQSPQSQVAYNSFEVRLPRPALDVKGLQLISTNIPQCNANIPDTACVFWYYRLSRYSGTISTFNNLFMNRLLPSFYKPEFINNYSNYGMNKTFGTYTNLSTETRKAGGNDLGYNNRLTMISQLNASGNNGNFDLEDWCNYYVPYKKNDIQIAYNSSLNRFQMEGLSIDPAWRNWGADIYGIGDIVAYRTNYTPYSSGVSYAVGQFVIYQYTIYQSVINDNVGLPLYNPLYWRNLGDVMFHPPRAFRSIQAGNQYNDPTTSPSWWIEIGTEVVSEWDATITYDQGRYVWAGENLYVSTTAETWNDNPTESPSKWGIVSSETQWYNYLITGYKDPLVKEAQKTGEGGGNQSFMVWNEKTLYEVGMRVLYQGKFWRCVKQIRTSPPIQADDWAYGITYNIGDLVNQRGKVFKSLQNANVDNYPAGEPTWWEVVDLYGWDDMRWRPDVEYYKQHFVWFNGIAYYLAVNSSTGDEPILDWTATTIYNIGDLAVFGEVIYESIVDGNVNSEPSGESLSWNIYDDAVWSQVEAGRMLYTSPVYGLNTIAREFDYFEDGVNSIYASFPAGLGQQPFNPNPKRLLNSILGFSWDGRFNPDELNIILQSNRVAPSQLTSFYNRIRPVPFYEAEIGAFGPISGSPDLRVGTPVVSVAYTYTADAYCNMVYSSIVNIYANIVGSSNVNTQRNATLLAITSMNCGNLGVAFWDNYVDNPLLRCERELYSIFIEFRDEFDEPFFLSNNAIASLTFKVIYE